MGAGVFVFVCGAVDEKHRARGTLNRNFSHESARWSYPYFCAATVSPSIRSHAERSEDVGR